MKYLKVMLQSLKNPTIALSIVAQVCAIFTLLGVAVNVDVITGVFTAVCTIFVTLGIMSNPNKTGLGMGEHIYKCTSCGKNTVHASINGKMTCTICGAQQPQK